MQIKKNEEFLKFNFDVSAYRLLGRELITDRITALFELVKNSYDANADNVTIEFQNIETLNNNSKIIITDDGLGMDINDVKYRWMVIGTSSKRRERKSPAPYNRKVSGKKGVGRFAVDKLGAKLILKTKKKGSDKLFCLETDWIDYSNIENRQLTLDFESKKEYFTDIKNKFWYEDADLNQQGTTLEISRIENNWTERDIIRAYKELSKLISPNNDLQKFPFRITIKTPYEKYLNKKVSTQLIEFATLSVELNFDIEKKEQEILEFKNNQLLKIKTEIRSCGPLRLKLYYFNEAAKQKFKKHYESEIEGIKIYRDGIITTPFAEYEAAQNEQKDILGIDKRRYSGFFDKLSSRDLLGYLEITDEDNSQIIESTNRQGFVDNESWYQLKKFIIEQLSQLEKYLKSEKNKSREITKSGLTGAGEIINILKKDIKEIKAQASAENKIVLNNIDHNLNKLYGTLNKSINDYIKLEEESKQKENLFFSLVSLQGYAAMFSHMTQHTIGHVIRDAEYFYNNFPDIKKSERFIKISKNIYDELHNLRKGVEFMLKYAKSDSDFEEINLSNLLSNLFNDIYLERFRIENIKTILDVNSDIILNYNKKALEDIFDNLITNSIKALINIENKIIKCSCERTETNLKIYFSDNGIGINEEDKFRIFDIFFTKTAEEGGAGMGLYMVKTRVEAMQGTIEVIENELKPKGATFEIIIPFNK